MACNINCKKVFVGGLVAGVGVNVVEFLAHHVILGERYKGLAKMGYYYENASFPNFPLVSILMSFAVGFLLAWLYAVGRDTLNPGPLTAIKIGLVVGFIASVPGNVAMLAWSPIGKLVPFVTCLAGFAECVIGCLLAGAIYKPKEASTSST